MRDIKTFTNPDFEEALLGMSHDGRGVYDHEEMVNYLVSEGVSPFEAEERVSNEPQGEGLPIIVYVKHEPYVEKHARWMACEHGFTCSACHYTESYMTEDAYFKRSRRYCPNCGAEMA